ncbi:Alcohol dehydrogenase transcription factor Myb/SANT-like, partial [Musa troglodytarum]
MAIESVFGGSNAHKNERSASLLPPPASLPPPLPSSSASIGAYRDKWYALRRGNLRASHWQEVADRYPSAPSPPKTSIRCRHKVEKHGKRYRSERHKSLRLGTSLPPSTWVYFRKMGAMEHGGSVEVGEPHRPSACQSPASSDDEENDDYEHRGAGGGSNTHGLHHLMTNGGGAIGFQRRAARDGGDAAQDGEEEEEEEDGDGVECGPPATEPEQVMMGSMTVNDHSTWLPLQNLDIQWGSPHWKLN